MEKCKCCGQKGFFWLSARAAAGLCRMILAAYAFLAVLLILIYAAGLKKYVVISGSMVPAIPVGSCILVKEKEAEQIQSGEIVTFYVNDRKTIVTHRVLEQREEEKCFITGGDANAEADPSPVPYTECIGTVWLTVPGAGYGLMFLNSVCGKASAVCLFLFCLGATAAVSGAERRNHG